MPPPSGQIGPVLEVTRHKYTPVKGRPNVDRLDGHARAQPQPHRVAVGAGFTCDFCSAPSEKAERRRLVWQAGFGNDLVLAELCGRCAAGHDRLLDRYGGHGRQSMVLEEASASPATWVALVGRGERALFHGLIYLMIAFGCFLIVTLVSSRS
jgi:hypothetical protein